MEVVLTEFPRDIKEDYSRCCGAVGEALILNEDFFSPTLPLPSADSLLRSPKVAALTSLPIFLISTAILFALRDVHLSENSQEYKVNNDISNKTRYITFGSMGNSQRHS